MGPLLPAILFGGLAAYILTPKVPPGRFGGTRRLDDNDELRYAALVWMNAEVGGGAFFSYYVSPELKEALIAAGLRPREQYTDTGHAPVLLTGRIDHLANPPRAVVDVLPYRSRWGPLSVWLKRSPAGWVVTSSGASSASEFSAQDAHYPSPGDRFGTSSPPHVAREDDDLSCGRLADGSQADEDQLLFAALSDLRLIPGLDTGPIFLSINGRRPSLALIELLSHLGIQGASARSPGRPLVSVTAIERPAPEEAIVRLSVQGDAFSGPLEYTLGKGPTGWMPIWGM